MSMDIRPADSVAPALYWPRECFVCGRTARPNSIYCSEVHRKWVEGEKQKPTQKPEQQPEKKA